MLGRAPLLLLPELSTEKISAKDLPKFDMSVPYSAAPELSQCLMTSDCTALTIAGYFITTYMKKYLEEGLCTLVFSSLLIALIGLGT